MLFRILREAAATGGSGGGADPGKAGDPPASGADPAKGGDPGKGDPPGGAADPKDAELVAERKKAADLAKRVKAFEDKEEESRKAKLSEEQKAKEERDTAQTELTRLQRENLVTKLAAKAGLDPDVWDRIKGTTEDEIEADIKFWQDKLPKPGEAGGDPPAGNAAKGKAPGGKPDYRNMPRDEFRKAVRSEYKVNI